MLALAFGEAAYILRTTRGAMEKVLGTQYILFLRAKGIAGARIVYRHALRNAASRQIDGDRDPVRCAPRRRDAIESLFALPGVGRSDRDLDPAAQLHRRRRAGSSSSRCCSSW